MWIRHVKVFYMRLMTQIILFIWWVNKNFPIYILLVGILIIITLFVIGWKPNRKLPPDLSLWFWCGDVGGGGDDGSKVAYNNLTQFMDNSIRTYSWIAKRSIKGWTGCKECCSSRIPVYLPRLSLCPWSSRQRVTPVMILAVTVDR